MGPTVPLDVARAPSVDACAGLVRIQCAPDEEVATLDQIARPLLSANRPEHSDGADHSKHVTVGEMAGGRSGLEAAIRHGLFRAGACIDRRGKGRLTW